MKWASGCGIGENDPAAPPIAQPDMNERTSYVLVKNIDHRIMTDMQLAVAANELATIRNGGDRRTSASMDGKKVRELIPQVLHMLEK
jgi:hypothetical protein